MDTNYHPVLAEVAEALKRKIEGDCGTSVDVAIVIRYGDGDKDGNSIECVRRGDVMRLLGATELLKKSILDDIGSDGYRVEKDPDES